MIIAAVLPPSGGARQVFYLGESGLVHLIFGLNVIRAADDVVRRKAPGSLPLLAQLLVEGHLKTSKKPTKKFTVKQIENAQSHFLVAPDATVLAEAMAAQPDLFLPMISSIFSTNGAISGLGLKSVRQAT